MNKKTITIIIVLICLNILTIFFFITRNEKEVDVFKRNIESIVELKAETSEDVQSFGTGVIIDSRGYIVTNSHIVTYSSNNEINEF